MRPAETQESAARAVLVAASEDASHLRGRRVLRDVALAFAGANTHVYPRVDNDRELFAQGAQIEGATCYICIIVKTTRGW